MKKNEIREKHHPMVFGLWIGFMGFAGVVALLFWLILHFSVGIQYQDRVETELDSAAQSICCLLYTSDAADE